MKKLVITLSVLALTLGAFVLTAAAEDMAYTGWVADQACAKDFAKAGNEAHKGCATGCLNGGDSVALASPDGFHLLDITNEAALEHLGMEVTVMGTLDEATNTITVTSINASS